MSSNKNILMWREQTNSMPVVSLSDFTHENANEAFGLVQQFKKSNLLDDWIKRSKAIEISMEEKGILNKLQDKLLVYGKAWNGQELKERFIAPITELVDFYNFDLKFGAFSDRIIEATIHNTRVRGKVDWIVASGQYQPKQPFFFLNKHKKDLNHIDPVGQLLATLYIAKDIESKSCKTFAFQSKPNGLPQYSIVRLLCSWYIMVFYSIEGSSVFHFSCL